jgi:signal transduction histidine kinase
MSKSDNVVPLRPGADRWNEDPPELNLRVCFCLGRYLRERYGEATAERVTRAAGLMPSDLDGKARWVSAARFATLLDAARAELASDAEFFEAFVHGYAATKGLGRYLMTLRSPIEAYARGSQMFALQSRVSAVEFARLGDRKVRLTYTTQREESRLMCLSRTASLTVFPTLWGLPRAHVKHERCAAEGDASCEYELTVYESTRRLPALIGAVAGIGLSASCVLTLDSAHTPWVLALPAVGAMMGHLLEMYRVNRHNIANGERAQEVLREVAEHDAEARRELNELHQRQSEWLVVMEEQLAERTLALQEVVQRIRSFQQSTHTTIRGLSHDLHNPLQVIQSTADMMDQYKDELGEHGHEMAENHAEAVRKIKQLFDELMQYVTTERLDMELAPQPIDVTMLTDRMRRQLRALAHGKPIRVSVFRVREAPERVVVDPMLLDRIIDNILTNAAKYTEQGSIVVEVGGTPGFLTVKVSDTGRGIEPERLARAFERDTTSSERKGYGVGLSVVVDLLGRIDGRVEVMSKPNLGTTFWVHVPVDMREEEPVERPSGQILTIRRSAS